MKFINSIPKLVLVEAYYFISKVKRYHRSLRYAYEIVIIKQLELFNANWLQIVVKAINDIIGSNGLILTLLIFEAYLKITELDLPNPTVE